jgi:hypothetical protein
VIYIVGELVGGDSSVFVMEDRQVFSNIWVFKDWSRASVPQQCKSHYIDCFIKEFGIDNSLDNPIYTPTRLKKQEIMDNHMSVFTTPRVASVTVTL